MTGPFQVTLRVDAAVSDSDAITLFKVVELPFLPRIGDMLGFGWNGDFVRVDEIYWSEIGGFEAFLDDIDSAQDTAGMRTEGWKEA